MLQNSRAVRLLTLGRDRSGGIGEPGEIAVGESGDRGAFGDACCGLAVTGAGGVSSTNFFT